MADNPLAYIGIYKRLRLHILSGDYQKGEKLPSRAALEEIYQTSGKTIRRVIQLLCDEGLIERQEKAAPLVIYDPSEDAERLQCADTDWLAAHAQQKDIRRVVEYMDSSALIGAAVIKRALVYCQGNDRLLERLDAILADMSPEEETVGRFWRSSLYYWRSIIAQLDNAFIMNMLEQLGFFCIAPRPTTVASRQAYWDRLKNIVKELRDGQVDSLCETSFDFSTYFLQGQDFMGNPTLHTVTPSFFDEPEEIEIYLAQKERYTRRIYLDLIGHICAESYQAGDYLPSHECLCRTYGVSRRTTTQAVKRLQELNIVQSRRGQGIQLMVSSKELRARQLDMTELTGRLRRTLEELQLAALTIQPVILYALKPLEPEEARALYQRKESQTGLISKPDELLKYICTHMRYPILKAFYNNAMMDVAQQRGLYDYSEAAMAELQLLDQQALEAAALLRDGQREVFAQKMAQLMAHAYQWLTKNICQAGCEGQTTAALTQESRRSSI